MYIHVFINMYTMYTYITIYFKTTNSTCPFYFFNFAYFPSMKIYNKGSYLAENWHKCILVVNFTPKVLMRSHMATTVTAKG